MAKWLCLAGGILLALVGVAGALVYFTYFETEVHAEYTPPPPPPDDILIDDRLEDRQPKFDPDVVDRRPEGEWRINASAAVIRLDVPMIRPDQEPDLLNLHASYAAAVKAASGRVVLPSVNMLDGKAKQFDDGLYAALDRANYVGQGEALPSHVDLVKRLYEKAGKDDVAAPFLAAGLELAGVRVEVANVAAKNRFLTDFRGNEVLSKPIGFYTWDDKLGDCFRFLRFFQYQFGEPSLEVPLALSRLIAQDPTLKADYAKAMQFFARLTNPYSSLTLLDIADLPVVNGDVLKRLAEQKKTRTALLAVFPASTSRETELFLKLFPEGLPPGVDLMRELVRAIRSGAVDLKPRANSGWYDHQVYALETMLLPERGQERDKLLLTKEYKKRMLEAFKALVTKRRETHVRQLELAGVATSMMVPLEQLQPRLRVEPCPSYYLRTARAYAFLANFLDSAVGAETLGKLHGLKQGGQRPDDLRTELNAMRDRFYGLYLVSAEDIGMKPDLAADENVDAERCYQVATEWLKKITEDADLAVDTRVSVPIFVDGDRGVTRIWATLGVRLAKLEASYARPPHVKPAKGPGEWKKMEAHRLASGHYVIAVDEFAEIELAGLRTLTREELRAVCDREKTKEAIVKALQK